MTPHGLARARTLARHAGQSGQRDLASAITPLREAVRSSPGGECDSDADDSRRQRQGKPRLCRLAQYLCHNSPHPIGPSPEGGRSQVGTRCLHAAGRRREASSPGRQYRWLCDYPERKTAILQRLMIAV